MQASTSLTLCDIVHITNATVFTGVKHSSFNSNLIFHHLTKCVLYLSQPKCYQHFKSRNISYHVSCEFYFEILTRHCILPYTKNYVIFANFTFVCKTDTRGVTVTSSRPLNKHLKGVSNMLLVSHTNVNVSVLYRYVNWQSLLLPTALVTKMLKWDGWTPIPPWYPSGIAVDQD